MNSEAKKSLMLGLDTNHFLLRPFIVFRNSLALFVRGLSKYSFSLRSNSYSPKSKYESLVNFDKLNSNMDMDVGKENTSSGWFKYQNTYRSIKMNTLAVFNGIFVSFWSPKFSIRPKAKLKSIWIFQTRAKTLPFSWEYLTRRKGLLLFFITHS